MKRVWDGSYVNGFGRDEDAFCDMCEEISIEEPHYVVECDIVCPVCGKIWVCDG